MPAVVAKNEDRPEHRPLCNPIERPQKPAIKIRRHTRQRHYNGNIPADVAERPHNASFPAELGNGGPYLTKTERRPRRRIELLIIPIMLMLHGDCSQLAIVLRAA